MTQQFYTCGELAAHARGRTLAMAFGAEATTDLPDSGAVIAFGKEFQGHDEFASRLSVWTHLPGRLLVLCPPFARQACETPVRWEAKRLDTVAGGDTELSRLLASERQHRFEGSLLPIERVGSAITLGGWRKHPAAGLLALTSLPLWSLTTLEHESACREWLSQLLANAGTPEIAEHNLEDCGEMELEPHDWALLLHHCTGPFEDREDCLKALDHSLYFHLESAEAGERLERLKRRGLINDCGLTESGDAKVSSSVYANYASELRSLNHVR
ncbi:MAG TPA: hypothetical protein PLY87_04645 [Planctomycetaceae bacterium]|nr:hypothetical protein [Planctomycetaceae bacterium]